MTEHTRRQSLAARRHDRRKAWLDAAPDRYAGVPGIDQDVDDPGRQKLDALVQEMLSLKLLGSETRERMHYTVRRLVTELRGEQIPVKW